MILALGRQKQRWVPGLHSKTVSNNNQQREEKEEGEGRSQSDPDWKSYKTQHALHTLLSGNCGGSILGFWTLKQVTASNLIFLADSPVLPRRMVVRK